MKIEEDVREDTGSEREEDKLRRKLAERVEGREKEGKLGVRRKKEKKTLKSYFPHTLRDL
jgi:hypothetical protein